MILTAIAEIVGNKDCTLLGSAPGLYIESDIHPDRLYVSCNLSSLGACVDRRPDITFIGSYTAVTSQVEHIEKLSEVKTRHLVIVGGAGDLNASSRMIEKAVEHVSISVITLDQKIEFLKDCVPLQMPWPWGVGKKIPSTGLMSALLLHFSGAASVKAVGFSSGPGHSYLDNNYPRGHLPVDCRIINWLRESGIAITFPENLLEHCRCHESGPLE